MANDFRDRVERGFEGWARIVSANPVSILLASLLFSLICIAGLSRVRVDVSFEAFLEADDPIRVSYDAFRDQFGRDERIIVAASPGVDSGPDGVFDLAFLERLRALHEAIEERVPYVDEITSLVNARDTRGEGDTLLVEDFLDPWPQASQELEVLRRRALANPLFRNTVISADGGITTLALELQLHSSIGAGDSGLTGFHDDATASGPPPPLLTSQETAELVGALYSVLEEFEDPNFVLHAAGPPIMIQDIASAMFHDMPRFVALAIATIALLLFGLFRRLVAVLLPLLVVILSVASTIGLMGWSDVAIHVPTQILPSFLLAVGVGDSVHLLTIFYTRIREGDARQDALAYALGHSGLALVLTSVTTAAGLASFIGAGLAPVAKIGIFAPIGVMFALLMSLTLLPALLQIVPVGAGRDVSDSDGLNRVDRLLMGFGRFATRQPRTVVAVSALIVFAAAGAAARLSLSHDPLAWLGEDSRIVTSTRKIDQALGGSVSFEILLESDVRGEIRQPETLVRMAKLGQSLEDDERFGLRAGQTISLADVVKEINQALEQDRDDAYVIPGDAQLVTQELLLFENAGTDDLEDMVDTTYQTGRIAVRMPWRDAVRYVTYLDAVEDDARAILGPSGKPSTTGMLALLIRASSAMVTSMARSYVIAFAIITPLMILLLGNLRSGLLAMIPNVAPIVLTLGLMGAFEFPLDAFSLLVGGIAIGLAVDDTIHFMHNYRRYRDHGMDLESAVDETLRTTGRAMLITTVALATGFLGFVLSSMHNLRNLGLLVSFALVTAFLADVLLAPALLALFDRHEDPA